MKLGVGPAAMLLLAGASLLAVLFQGIATPRPPTQAERDARLLARFADAPRLHLGEVADELLLIDPEGRPYATAIPHDGKPVVVWFWSVSCRCVRDCEERILTLLERYADGRIHFLAVDSNPDDSAADVQKLRMSMDSPYEVLRDAHGATARHLGVLASASVAVLDGEGRIRFRGAIDDDLYEPTVSYVHAAVDAILAGEPVTPTTAKTYGCRFPLDLD